MNKLEQAARLALDALIKANHFHDYEDEITALREALAEQALQKLSDFHQMMEQDHIADADKMIECRHCGFLCKPNPNESRKWYPLEQAEPKCSQHPDAPHGFDRNASHNAGRYVCECEEWMPEQAEQEPVAWLWVNERGSERLEWEPVRDISKWKSTPLYAAPVQQAEQEPVAWINEDELPEHYPYDDMYESSKVISGVRMFPNVRLSDRSMFYALTKDHTWISVTETQFNKLKPEYRMKCYAAPVRTKDLTDDEICKANKTELPDCQDLVDFARAVIAADREKNK